MEVQILGTVSTDSSLCICPIVRQEKLFVRYIETGMYKGFNKKFPPVLTQKHSVSLDSTFLWNVYTDKDIEAKGRNKKYKDQQVRQFQKMQYSNQSSVGHVLTDVKNQLDPLKAVLYIQKKKARPSHHEDRY